MVEPMPSTTMHRSRFVSKRIVLALTLLMYVLFGIFWSYWVFIARVGIVDSIDSRKDVSFMELTPWHDPDNGKAMKVRGLEYHQYQYRNGSLKTFFYDVKFTQILPSGKEMPILVERDCRFTLRFWPVLSGPLLLAIVIIHFLLIVSRSTRFRDDVNSIA